MLCVMNCEKINKCIGNQQCNRHLYFPGQHYRFQGFFQTFPHQWSFSRLFKALKISTLYFKTFHTFPGSVWTLLYSPVARPLTGTKFYCLVTGTGVRICNCNWGTCIAHPTRRPRAHHRVNPYPGACRQNETEIFSDHDVTAGGSMFQTLAVATGEARSPMVYLHLFTVHVSISDAFCQHWDFEVKTKAVSVTLNEDSTRGVQKVRRLT